MSRRRRREKEDLAKKREPGAYIAVSRTFLQSSQVASLSPYALKLLIDLLAQYNGRSNNGDLCAAWKFMRQRGWRSKDTLQKARDELVAREFILVTRAGGRNRPTLYGLTLFDIDYCNGKLDLEVPTSRFKGRWRLAPADESAQRIACPDNRVNSKRIDPSSRAAEVALTH